MSTQQTTGCPAPERLREMLAGELAASVQEELTRHIETCSTCQATLDGWLSSPSVEGLAAAGTDSATHDAALRELMAQLSKKSTGAPTEAETIASQSPPGAPTPPASENITQMPGVQTEALAFLAAATPPGQPARLGHFQIRGVVGQGGFGVVLKAFDEKLERVVAIKALLPAYAAVGSARKRFVREAKTAAAVKNEHVVAIYGVQDEAQPPYLVMELIDGISLQDKLDRVGPLPVKEILRIGMQTAEGLAAAHKQGLVHRDIKPANILLENGVERVKLTDFGLARAVDDASMTQSGTVAGTPVYMSPEQAGGLAIDHRSDLFSLGTVLYALCTGHPPFRGSGTHAVLMRVIEDTPRPIREVNNEIPNWLSDIIGKLHAKKPEDRFQTAKEVGELLGQHLAHLQQPGSVPAPAPILVPVKAPSPGTLEKLLEGSDTSRRLLQHGLSTVVLVMLVAGVGIAFNSPLLWVGVALLWAALLLGIGVAQIKQRWSVTYRGHMIRFENSCFTGESLFIDNVRVARGGVGLRNEVRAMIPRGEGAGQEIVVFAESGLLSFHCRIVVEHSPAPERSARLAFAAKVQRVLVGAGALAAVAMVVVAVSMSTWMSNRTFPVTFQMDEPEIVVRIWPTAQTSPPVNLAGGFDIFGEPAHLVRNSTNTLLFLPSGHYWLKAELDGQEVERIFFHVLSDSLETHHIEVVGQNVSAVGNTVVGLPKVITVPGAARLLQLEKNKLQGGWHAVAAVMDGKPMPKEMIAQNNPRIVFKGDRITMTQNMPQLEKIDETYTLHPRQKPGTLDIPKGFKNRDTMLAIYRWEGPNTLRICAGPQGRPNDFTSSPGSERVLFTLWRDSGVTAPDPEPGWVQLFNGRDLAGWVAPQPGLGDWQVDKLGHLVGKGDPRSYLFTQRDDFTDFHLRAELQVGGGSAGGICFRSGLNRLPLQLAPGYKASLTSDPPPGSLLLTHPETKGGQFIAVAAKTEFKASTWFTMEVIARGNHLTVKTDGKTVAEYTDAKATYTSGRIALETYLPATVITFKKVEIRELPPTLPKKAADIPRFVAGTWKIESTIIKPKVPPEHARLTGFNVYEPIAQGKFLRVYSNYGPFESLMVQHYDEPTDSVRGWFFGSDGINTGPGVGRWNPDTRTMLWLEKLPDGLHATYEFEFADANTIKTRVFKQNDQNEIVFELKGTGTRLPGPVELKPAPIDPKRPAAMKIFDEFIGEWDTAGTMKTMDMPAGFKFTTHLKSRSMLGSRLVETRETGLPGHEDLYWLMTYDTSLKAYRSWLFNGAGEVMTLGGGWDEKSGTLKWNEAKPDGSTAASTWRMVNPDRWEWSTLIKDAVGNTLFDIEATKTRKMPAGKKPRPNAAEELPPKVRDAVDKGLLGDSGYAKFFTQSKAGERQTWSKCREKKLVA